CSNVAGGTPVTCATSSGGAGVSAAAAAPGPEETTRAATSAIRTRMMAAAASTTTRRWRPAAWACWSCAARRPRVLGRVDFLPAAAASAEAIVDGDGLVAGRAFAHTGCQFRGCARLWLVAHGLLEVTHGVADRFTEHRQFSWPKNHQHD